MPLILPIPAQTPDQMGLTIYKLMQLSSIVNATNETHIILDFVNTRFLHNSFILCLFTLINDWRLKGKIVEIGKFHSKAEGYFGAINFPNGYLLDGQRDLGYYHSKRFTPLVVFPIAGNRREECIGTVLDVVKSQVNAKDHNYINTLDYFLTELTNNVADHSEVDNGTVFVQTYPNKGFMDIAIGDNGIGIYASYGKTHKFNPTNEADAIRMAVNGNSTKDLAESRGFGISRSRILLIKGLKGTFFLWSGENTFVHNENRQDILKVQPGAGFTGCFLILRLPLKVNEGYNFYELIG